MKIITSTEIKAEYCDGDRGENGEDINRQMCELFMQTKIGVNAGTKLER